MTILEKAKQAIESKLGYKYNPVKLEEKINEGLKIGDELHQGEMKVVITESGMSYYKINRTAQTWDLVKSTEIKEEQKEALLIGIASQYAM